MSPNFPHEPCSFGAKVSLYLNFPRFPHPMPPLPPASSPAPCRSFPLSYWRHAPEGGGAPLAKSQPLGMRVIHALSPPAPLPPLCLLNYEACKPCASVSPHETTSSPRLSSSVSRCSIFPPTSPPDSVFHFPALQACFPPCSSFSCSHPHPHPASLLRPSCFSSSSVL